MTLSGRNRAESPFAVETVSTFHDEKGGALRGENTIHILRAEGLTLVHCGDLGHELSEEHLKKIKGCDALLIPVGGYYTIDAQAAKAVVDVTRPRVIIPMHYRRGDVGFSEIGELSDFTDRFAEVRYEDSPLELTRDTPRGVVVLTPELS